MIKTTILGASAAVLALMAVAAPAEATRRHHGPKFHGHKFYWYKPYFYNYKSYGNDCSYYYWKWKHTGSYHWKSKYYSCKGWY